MTPESPSAGQMQSRQVGITLSEGQPVTTTTRRVLAIRPDPALVTTLTGLFDRSRCEVESCAGNVEAVRRLRVRAADVVITDESTTMDEDVALATELVGIRPSLKVIALASFAGPGDVVEAIRANVFACFTAPIDYAEVASMASSAVSAETWKDGIQVVSGLDHWLTLRVSCHLVTADRLTRFMAEMQPSTVGDDRELLLAAFREMLLNAMEHGAGFDAEKVIEVTAAKTERAIVYHFRDPGDGFDRTDLQHATQSSDPDEVLAAAMARAEMGLRPGGFGMLIARQVADELVYNERGNEVLLIKHLK
jgi:anti-sigma regulatory factor (Ser/Thr protein kinase)/ActR/RegA family two-component response regulator